MKRLFLTSFISTFLLAGLYGQSDDDITFFILNGDFQRCVADSLVEIQIVPNPNLSFSQITLVWNDVVQVDITDSSQLTQSYTFPISELTQGCDYPPI